jgi:hypothetical protein
MKKLPSPETRAGAGSGTHVEGPTDGGLVVSGAAVVVDVPYGPGWLVPGESPSGRPEVVLDVSYGPGWLVEGESWLGWAEVDECKGRSAGLELVGTERVGTVGLELVDDRWCELLPGFVVAWDGSELVLATT